jgi:hypothetical protein
MVGLAAVASGFISASAIAVFVVYAGAERVVSWCR